MTIVAADLKLRLSTASGAAGNTLASTAAEALGKYVSTTEIAAASLHNLFDAVTGAEAAVGAVEYRCLFVLNNHATDQLWETAVWI